MVITKCVDCAKCCPKLEGETCLEGFYYIFTFLRLLFVLSILLQTLSRDARSGWLRLLDDCVKSTLES